MKSITVSYDSAAASVTGFASLRTGASWPLTATVSGDGVAHKVTIKGDQVADHSLKTAIITGVGPDGIAQSETVNLPNGTATVTSALFYMSLTSVVPSATIGTDTMGLGWAAASVSPGVSLMAPAAISSSTVGIGCTVVSGSPNYGLETSQDGVLWIVHDTIAGETTSQVGAITVPSAAVRLAWTVAGEVSAAFLVPYM